MSDETGKSKLDVWIVNERTGGATVVRGSAWTVGDLINLEFSGLQIAVRKDALERSADLTPADDGK